jgi:hypothetical protein
MDEGMPRIPEPDVLNRQLADVLVRENNVLHDLLRRLQDAMNIPKAKVAELMMQSSERKWQLVWAQVGLGAACSDPV